MFSIQLIRNRDIDQRTMKIEELPNIIMERTISSIDFDEKDLSFFVKRLSKAHITIDYMNDTKENVVSKLVRMIGDRSEGMTQEQIIKTQLNTFENDLDREIVKTLNELNSNLILKNESFIKKVNIQLDYIKISKNNILQNENTISVKEKKIEEIKNFLKTVDSKILQYKEEIKDLQQNHMSNLKQVSDIESLIETSNRIMNEFELINYRCDSSKSGITKYFVELKISFNQNYNKNKIILVLQYENDDITFKRYLKNDSLIPDNLQKIAEFREAVVLYNNGILNNNFRVTKNNNIDNTIEFDAECNLPFKVYVYTNTTAKNTNVDIKIRKKLNDDREKFNTCAKNNLIDIEKTEIEIKNISLKDQDKRNEQLKFENELSELMNSNFKENENIKKYQIEIVNILVNINDLKQQTLDDISFKNSKNIEQIFKDNRIICGFSNLIKDISSYCNSLNSYCDNIRKVYHYSK